jgi:hypothetical protein
LGELLRAALGAERDVNEVRWVVFHLHYPGYPFGPTETATRNWIAVRRADVASVNEVHDYTIGKPIEEVSRIYAPSIIAQKMLGRKVDRLNEMVKLPWLMSLPSTEHVQRCQQGACSNSMVAGHSSGLLCVVPTEWDNNTFLKVQMVSCAGSAGSRIQATLGELLDEPERQAANRYFDFVRLIFDFPSPRSHPGGPKCNVYLRIPIMWSGADTYLSEVYVAFNTTSDRPAEIMRVFRPLATVLRNCVSLVNSEVAYTVAEKVAEVKEEERVRARFLGHRHSIVNMKPGPLLHAALLQDEDQMNGKARTFVADAEKTTEVLFATLDFVMSKKHKPLQGKSIAEILAWLKEHETSGVGHASLEIDPAADFLPAKDTMEDVFLVLWNLWHNAAQRGNFAVHLGQYAGFLRVVFSQKSEWPKHKRNWVDYLNGVSPSSPNTEREKRGLEIVKQSLHHLRWNISVVAAPEVQITLEIAQNQQL